VILRHIHSSSLQHYKCTECFKRLKPMVKYSIMFLLLFYSVHRSDKPLNHDIWYVVVECYYMFIR
jgi:hypothetical protein